MKYPENLNENDTIGVTAISAGISEEYKQKRFDNAILKLKQKGFNIIETDNVRKNIKNRSSSKEQRKKEFMELWNNKNVKTIIFARGGDFAMEVLDILDLDYIESSKPKWIQGYSDITTISFVYTTMLDIATIYGYDFGAFGMEEYHKSLQYNLDILKGKEIIQYSFDKYEKKEFDQEKYPYIGYNLDTENKWKSLEEEEFKISGRIIGGCLDVILNLIGTKYDNVNNFLEKYKKDGIVWFLEICESNTVQVQIALWQLKNAGYFKYCKGIIFGRSMICPEYFDITFEEAVKNVLEDLKIKIIYDADIGHVPPQLTIINGAITEIKYKNGEGNIKFIKS